MMMKRFFFFLLALSLCSAAFCQEFAVPDRPKAPGEVRVLCIGNSFTYVCHTDSMLQDISRSQGLELQIGKYLHGGRTFGQHLEIERSRAAVDAGGYDFAFLQDQSCTPAKYALWGHRSILDHFLRLKDSVLRASPGCTVFLERTWTYPNLPGGDAEVFGTAESLDAHLREGCRQMALQGGTRVSPIGDAFTLAGQLYPGIRLLAEDNHHQNLAGAYLKACVNYLLIAGKPFSGEVACCGVAPADAAALRSVAERIVFDEPQLSKPRRWRIASPGVLAWEPAGDLPHGDFIEMSGQRVSSIVRYRVAEDRSVSVVADVVWPMLRTVPNNTHASLQRSFADDLPGRILLDGAPRLSEKVRALFLDGTLRIESDLTTAGNATLHLTRTLFPSTDSPAFLQEYVLENAGDRPVRVEVPDVDETWTTEAADGVYGAYRMIRHVEGKTLRLDPGASVRFSACIAGFRPDEQTAFPDGPASLEARRALVASLQRDLVLETPDDVLNTMFAFAKVRGCESIFATKNGPVHSPGGNAYYAAVWANDQAEYINPFFPFTGYALGREAALNSFRWFAAYMNPEYRPIPSSIIAEGTDFWNGAGDRGDMAMIAYGAARFALASGDKAVAAELWPLVTWCLEYCRRHLTPEGVVASDTDELEGRFPAGKANLNTSCLYYDALLSAAWLGAEVGAKSSVIKDFRTRAAQMSSAIEAYFGASVQGYDTYRYYAGGDLLRSWISTPLTVGLFHRRDATLDALFSDQLWTPDGLLTQQGTPTLWDRSTLYAMRGALYSGAADRVMPFLQAYSAQRLLGGHVPYAVEAYTPGRGDEGAMRHLSAESGLYCRVFTEGLFGIRPTGLSSFTMTPQLPAGWDAAALRHVRAFGGDFDVEVTRSPKGLNVKVTDVSGAKPRVVLSKAVRSGASVSCRL